MKPDNRWKRAAVCLTLWGALWGVRGQVTITEFLAGNTRTLADKDREYVDWIEIHNAGAQAVNLSGWRLTDDQANLARYVLPEVQIAPAGYLVVFASGKNLATAGQELHTSFRLNTGGGYLALVGPDGVSVASEFNYPRQLADVSYGSFQGTNFYYLKPTPGAANGVGLADLVSDTRFSQRRGFYQAPFQLEIATETAGASIRYTTNGATPTASSGSLYTGPISIPGTTVVRAMAYREGYVTSRVDTATFVFVSDVIRQSRDGKAPSGWPSSWGANTVNYGMDPDVVDSAAYRDTIEADLQTIPSFAITTDLENLFDRSRGIYANASQQGASWERPCSVELLYPDGRDGFQINAGLRVRGGYSRSSGNPKHAFRFFFRRDYGDGALRYPMFASQEGVETFDCFDLRTFQNYSWSFEGDSRGVFMRDQFSRDTQFDMGHPAERGDYYHLYINGQYWGLFNTDERPEADYAATYFGGDSADYDVIKVESGSYTIKATDGTMDAWTRLYNQAKAGFNTEAAYQRVQGNNPDGTPNPDYEALLDLDNLIDYMLVIYYGGNLDAPISNFLGNTSPNNWYGIRNRYGREGFRFFSHDAEHTLLNVNEDRTGPYTAGNNSVLSSSPQWIFQKLWVNAEFKLRVADHLQRHFFNDGALTPAAATARFLKRKNEIDRAVVGESARWGDSKRNTPLTRTDWLNTVNNIVNNYFPNRTAIVLAQLKRKGLYPNVAAPVFSQFGGPVERGFPLNVSNATGTTYYTVDGTDPRVRGGAVSAGAQAYRAPLTLNESLRLRARTLVGSEWSALVDASFIVRQHFTNLVVSEIMYHPADEPNASADSFEFLELKNLEAQDIDVSGVSFTNGIRYTLPAGTRLAPGQFVVLVNNATNFARRYPAVRVDGVYTGSLANGGETVALSHADGSPILSFAYSDQAPWPTSADGLGFSLVPVRANESLDPRIPANWRPSSAVGGSPGADDPPGEASRVFINEALTRSTSTQPDAIELYNAGAQTADVSGWFLTNDRGQPAKYRLPAGSVLAPGAFLVLDETLFGAGTNGFRLDAQGGQVFLYSANAAGELTGFSDGFAFGAAEEGTTVGRYTNSVGDIQYPTLAQPTLGTVNREPRVGPVVINEIHYQPAAGDAEFVEILNLTDAEVPLYDTAFPTNTWRLDGAGFTFPPSSALGPHGLALIVGGDPAVFRARYSVPEAVPVFGPYAGALQDGGELLRLLRPLAPVTDGATTSVPYLAVDEVRYGTQAPWPTDAAGEGVSLERIRADRYGNDPANWRASFGLPSAGLPNDGNRMPRVTAGADQTFLSAAYPLVAHVQADAADDGLPETPGRLTVTWTQLSGPGPVVFGSPGQLGTDVSLPGVGVYTLQATVDDGQLRASDTVLLTASRPATEATWIASGSVWKYNDSGSDLGTAWRALGYNDSSWASGKAQLGYGDGDEATRVGYGPSSSSKYVTTYFRKSFVVTDAASVTGLKVKLLRDDGGVVYLNGTEVFRSAMPEGDITFDLFASEVASGEDETSTFYEQAVDPSLLKEDTNVLAVEIHQVNATSTDLSFDLALEGVAFPQNRPPLALAGDDLTVALPATAALRGSFSDDGLPASPGVVTATWSALDGPGPVAFSDTNRFDASASFTVPGSYHLQLAVSDGSALATDSLEVTVTGGAPTAPRFDSVAWLTGSPAGVGLRFQTEAGHAYTVQYRDSLVEGEWRDLQIVPASTSAGTADIVDPVSAAQPQRFYRLLAR